MKWMMGTPGEAACLAAAMILATLLAVESRADSPPTPPDCAAAAGPSAEARSPAGGLRVAIDPATGLRLPDAGLHGDAILAPPANISRPSPGELVVVQRPDGSKYVDLRGRFMCGLAVRIGPGGAIVWCTTAPHAVVPALPPVDAKHRETR